MSSKSCSDLKPMSQLGALLSSLETLLQVFTAARRTASVATSSETAATSSWDLLLRVLYTMSMHTGHVSRTQQALTIVLPSLAAVSVVSL